MKILIACEESGIVREAFNKLGHDAWSCDIVDTSLPGNHIKDNVLNHLNDGWDLMIAHPPCTRLCNSGVRWLEERNLWNDLKKSLIFFKNLQEADISKICIENPIPHKYTVRAVGKYTQLIQPWQFGHGETKATCLWLKGLPKLKSTNVVEGRDNKIHKMSPSKERSKLRSKTFPGIAKAMAEQWGTLLLRPHKSSEDVIQIK